MTAQILGAMALMTSSLSPLLPQPQLSRSLATRLTDSPGLCGLGSNTVMSCVSELAGRLQGREERAALMSTGVTVSCIDLGICCMMNQNYFILKRM